MDKTTTQTIARFTAATVLGLGVLAMLYPTLSRPDVSEVLAVCAKTGAICITVSGAAVAVGFAWDRIATWAAKRPPTLAPITLPMQFASDHEALALAHEDAFEEGEPDYAGSWQKAMIRFALVSRWGGFGWRAMKRYAGYEDWKTCTRLMIGAEVLVPSRGNQAPDWAGGWSYSRFRVSLKYGRLALPFPIDAPPPVVSW